MLGKISFLKKIRYQIFLNQEIAYLNGLIRIHLQCSTMSSNCRYYNIMSCYSPKMTPNPDGAKNEQLDWQIRPNLTNDHHLQYLMQSIVQYCRQHHVTLI